MRKYTIIYTLLLLTTVSFARENVSNLEAKHNENGVRDAHAGRKSMKFGSDCDPATQQSDLDINNVRTRILNGGDMWWDLTNARYEVPALPAASIEVRKNSMFSGAIWIGGEDLAGNLKLAAMTYRQRGSDFWPGPLDPNTGNTGFDQCKAWDDIYKVDGADIIEHVKEYEANGSVADVARSIENWPGEIAPFFEKNGVPGYQPQFGDYPILQNECRGEVLTGEKNEAEDQPDQMLFFVYNDKGNIHSESQGDPIGVEMQTTAFAYATNDEINNMTFYTTKIINRGSKQILNTYFGQWVDPDLGNFSDDYVGCDVDLSLGFCYNGDDNDEGVLGYGLNPPSVGVDFFEGPKFDTTNANTNQQDTIELGMERFVYYNNDRNPINGNPQIPNDYYNYLRGRWRNNNAIEFGGNGVTGTDGTPAKWMFPFDTDPEHASKNWNEKQAGNTPADRRFLQSAGPFTLKPGAVNKLTVGVVWARSSFGGAEGSLGLLKIASEKAQELFNSCFDLIDGPDAPEVEIQELDRSIAVSFLNTNQERIEGYKEAVLNGQGNIEEFEFEGYRIYQLRDGSVSATELRDITLAREVFQCDIENKDKTLINGFYDPSVEEFNKALMVNGADAGLSHSILLEEDAFASSSNKQLVNFKTYHYILVAYASEKSLRAQGVETNREYLEGRKIQKFTASPRKEEPRFGGSNPQASYGEGPRIMQLSGQGNGGNQLELTQASIDEILKPPYYVKNPVYEKSFGPVKIEVIDPLKVPNGVFELTMTETPEGNNNIVGYTGVVGANTTWKLEQIDNGAIEYSQVAIDTQNQQVILEATTGDPLKDWGLAVNINQVEAPGLGDPRTNGLISWEVEWEDPAQEWLGAISDFETTTANTGAGPYDWIRSGIEHGTQAIGDESWHDFIDFSSPAQFLDSFQVYEKIWFGRVAPYRLTSFNTTGSRQERFIQGIGYGNVIKPNDVLEDLASIDLVITKDKSKWSKCVMLESSESPERSIDGVPKFGVRKGPQVTFEGQTLPEGITVFPGYAINVETGERLEIVVTEDSYQKDDNGQDMLWNPTDNTANYSTGYPSFGGRHYIYVIGTQTGLSPISFPSLGVYDEGKKILQLFNDGQGLIQVMDRCIWTIPTYLNRGYEMKKDDSGIPVPPSGFKLKLRVEKPYSFFQRNSDVNNGLPKYRFSTEDLFNQINDDNGKNALDLVNVVPNPYYAFSGYEGSSIDNRVKFVNLPKECTISIYTLDGSLVRRINKDDPSTTYDWDIKNNAAVPISSGMYLIHVDGGALGEKMIKWMGIMRELDLDSF